MIFLHLYDSFSKVTNDNNDYFFNIKNGILYLYPENKMNHLDIYNWFNDLVNSSNNTKLHIHIVTRSGFIYYNLYKVLPAVKNFIIIVKEFSLTQSVVISKHTNIERLLKYDHLMIHNHVKDEMLRNIRPGHEYDGSTDSNLGLFKLLEGKKINV